MGQRLVIRFLKASGSGSSDNDIPLAACYWHWSGYTGSSNEITVSAINCAAMLKGNGECKCDPKRLAIETLLMIDGRARFENEDEYTEYYGEFISDEYRGSIDRNYGLISIHKDTIDSVMKFAEASADIRIDGKGRIIGITQDFVDCMSLKELSDLRDDDSIKDIYEVQKDDWIDPDSEMTVKEFMEFSRMVDKAMNSGMNGMMLAGSDTVYSFIE